MPTPAMTGIAEQTYDEVRREALAPNSEVQHPLPLVGSWNASTWWNFNTSEAGFYPGWQLDMLKDGHHFLPWFEIPLPGQVCEEGKSCTYRDYFELPIKKAADLQLPISFKGTQWERLLYDDPLYFDIAPDENPNVVSLDGRVQKRLSPFGSVKYWYDAGQRWGASAMMQQVIAWYPDPPLVLFVSNNEADKLTWSDAESDRHYLDLYGYGRDDDFKRQVFAKGWEERYDALLRGFRDGLGNTAWRANAKFIAYQAFGPSWFGWGNWEKYSLYVPGRIDPNPLFWQGGSSSLYIQAGFGVLDNNVQGALFCAMNWPFILSEDYKINPSYWYEFSVWDGDQVAQDSYLARNQVLTPERYGGFVQFGMWIIRPRLVRLYRDWDQARSAMLPWGMPVFNAVDKVYTDPVLKDFWRSSTLVPNDSRPHPFQSDIPPEFSHTNRMFLLNTNMDPLPPWSPDTEFPVMSLARLKGASPRRQWLLYAFAPLGSTTDAQIEIPDFRTVMVNVAVEGSFYLIDEETGSIRVVGQG